MSKRELASLQHANREHLQYDLARRMLSLRQFQQPGDRLEVWVEFHPSIQQTGQELHEDLTDLLNDHTVCTAHELVLAFRADWVWQYRVGMPQSHQPFFGLRLVRQAHSSGEYCLYRP